MRAAGWTTSPPNTAYCYLASGLSRETQPEHGGIGEVQELVEADLVETLAAVRDGLLPFHAIHAAARADLRPGAAGTLAVAKLRSYAPSSRQIT